MLPNLFILNNTGDVLIEKHFIGHTKRTICDLFWEEVQKCSKQSHVSPIITTENNYLISIRRNSMFFLSAITKSYDIPPLLIIEILHKILQTFIYYFNDKLTETLLRENFALIYQLLDELCVGGFPHTTEMNQLSDMISLPSMITKISTLSSGNFIVKSSLPSAFHNSKMPWRKSDCKYVTNEIKIDIIESISAILQVSNISTRVIQSNINGSLDCSCKLSATPDLILHFNNARMITHAQLHRCVRISRWQKEKVVSFVPPDGRFTLMKYRMGMNCNSSSNGLPLDIQPFIHLSSKKASPVKIRIKTNSMVNDKSVDKVLLEIPFPSEVLSFSLSADYGKVSQDEITKVVRWHIGRLPKEKEAVLEGTVCLPSDWMGSGNPSVRVGFEIKGLSMTGLRVDSLAVHNTKYKPFKGVRHITKAGVYIIRCE